MKKTQHHRAGAIRQITQQHAPAATAAARAAILDFSMFDNTFKHSRYRRLQTADGHHAGAVFVTQRHVKQQILHRVDLQFFQLPGQRRANALKGSNALLFDGV